MVLLMLTSCGFRPLHGSFSKVDSKFAATLGDIAISSEEDNFEGYAIRRALEERLRTGYSSKPLYRLELTNGSKDNLLTGAPSLTTLTLTTKFKLYAVEGNKLLFEDSASYAGYLIQQNADPLAVTLSREREIHYMLSEIAEKIAYRLECYFLQIEDD